jgi:molybdenum cofactor synthesis domain-containing protein
LHNSRDQKGRVVSVNVSVEKGTPKTPVPEIVLNETGVAGDAHAGPWHRQVSLLGVENIRRFEERSGRAFQCGDFAENITTEGIDLAETGVLDTFEIGGARLEVTQIGKKCHGDGCAIFQTVGQCAMPKEGIFCRVIEGGVICTGAEVIFRPRPLRIHVITLSDRASQGVYDDRSGPRIVELLETFFAERRWHPIYERAVLPDDAAQLRQALTAARDSGVDVVFTTGGTGVGPRDVTPEVVTSMADKMIPGIMEYIRLKYGADKPNALLSRSVAAVLDRTLVYTLPGSVRAVDEYIGEIVKTLEHLIYTLHGLDTH